MSTHALRARPAAPDLGGGDEPLDGIALVEDFSPPAKRDGDEEPAKHFQTTVEAVEKAQGVASIDDARRRSNIATLDASSPRDVDPFSSPTQIVLELLRRSLFGVLESDLALVSQLIAALILSAERDYSYIQTLVQSMEGVDLQRELWRKVADEKQWEVHHLRQWGGNDSDDSAAFWKWLKKHGLRLKLNDLDNMVFVPAWIHEVITEEQRLFWADVQGELHKAGHLKSGRRVTIAELVRLYQKHLDGDELFEQYSKLVASQQERFSPFWLKARSNWEDLDKVMKILRIKSVDELNSATARSAFELAMRRKMQLPARWWRAADEADTVADKLRYLRGQTGRKFKFLTILPVMGFVIAWSQTAVALADETEQSEALSALTTKYAGILKDMEDSPGWLPDENDRLDLARDFSRLMRAFGWDADMLEYVLTLAAALPLPITAPLRNR